MSAQYKPLSASNAYKPPEFEQPGGHADVPGLCHIHTTHHCCQVLIKAVMLYTGKSKAFKHNSGYSRCYLRTMGCEEAQTINPKPQKAAPPRSLATACSTPAPAPKVATMRGSAAGAALCTAVDETQHLNPRN